MADQVHSNRPRTAHVKVKGNGMNIDLMLKIFKRKVKESGILEEYKKRTEYIKPSEKKKDKMNASRKRQRKLDREME
jgi:small subunit ribosomal protein S21